MSVHHQVADLGRWIADDAAEGIQSLGKAGAAQVVLDDLAHLSEEEQRDAIAMAERYGEFLTGCRRTRERRAWGWWR